jgi:hypothetical protein
MSSTWQTLRLNDEKRVFEILAELKGRRWVCRGQSKDYGGLTPSIDREKLQKLSRPEKLRLERESIHLFQSTARFFADEGEKAAWADDGITMMVLRHYGVPTRLLDWSMSPYVAAYFAVCEYSNEDGEIWSFDEPLYEKNGKHQWQKWPETISDGRFDAKLTAFSLEERFDWIICAFYPDGFPRQNAQQAAYTMTAQFNRDHARVMANLLNDPSRFYRYIVPRKLKTRLLISLRDRHGIWRGSLFPDSAGAAGLARAVFPK